MYVCVRISIYASASSNKHEIIYSYSIFIDLFIVTHYNSVSTIVKNCYKRSNKTNKIKLNEIRVLFYFIIFFHYLQRRKENAFLFFFCNIWKKKLKRNAFDVDVKENICFCHFNQKNEAFICQMNGKSVTIIW